MSEEREKSLTELCKEAGFTEYQERGIGIPFPGVPPVQTPHRNLYFRFVETTDKSGLNLDFIAFTDPNKPEDIQLYALRGKQAAELLKEYTFIPLNFVNPIYHGKTAIRVLKAFAQP